jgi:hypothetical protein
MTQDKHNGIHPSAVTVANFSNSMITNSTILTGISNPAMPGTTIVGSGGMGHGLLTSGTTLTSQINGINSPSSLNVTNGANNGASQVRVLKSADALLGAPPFEKPVITQVFNIIAHNYSNQSFRF